MRQVVEEAVQPIVDLMARFDEVNNRFAEELTSEEMDALVEEQGRLQEEIDRVNGWELDNRLEVAMDALRCPPPDTPISVLSGGELRRVALCRLLLPSPTSSCSTSRPTTSTRNRWRGWRNICSSTRARSSP